MLTSGFHLCLIATTVVGVVYSSGVCPDDVQVSTHACLHNYVDQLGLMQLSGVRFFTGVDVEQIRFICSWLDSSVACIRDIRDSCPESRYGQIEDVIRSHISVLDMCKHANIYEEYAMNQNCFARTGVSSESCYRTFTSTTSDLEAKLSVQQNPLSLDDNTADRQTSNVDDASLRLYCSRLTDLIDCVKVNIRTSCSNMAAMLANVLVRASVRQSSQCVSESTNQAVVSSSHVSDSSRMTGTKGQRSKENAERLGNSNTASSMHTRNRTLANSPFNCFQLILVTIILVLIYLPLLRYRDVT